MKSIKIIVPCACITLLLVVAMCQGFDGVLLASGLTIIGGIAGYSIKLKQG